MGVPLSQLTGSAAFKFEKGGDTVKGRIVSAEQTQQTDLDTGVAEFWDEGRTRPKLMLKVTLQTGLRDSEADDGLRVLYAKGGRFEAATGSGLSMQDAIVQAAKEAGAASIDEGAELAVRFTGEGKQAKRGFSAPKLYTAKYWPAAKSVSLDEFGGQPAPQQGFQPAPQQYAPQPQQFAPAPQQGFQPAPQQQPQGEPFPGAPQTFAPSASLDDF